MVIEELRKINRDCKDAIELEDEQIVVNKTANVSSNVHKTNVSCNVLKTDVSCNVLKTDVSSSEASAMVVYKPPAHNQLQYIDSSALSMTTHLRSTDNCEHELELKNYDKRFSCNGCKEDGFRKRYRCKHCDYELHENCKDPKAIISHELFGNLSFKFSREKPTCGSLCSVHKKSCEACRNEIHGFSYHCEAKDLYLHPMCVNFAGEICIEGETFTLLNKTTFKCFWCKGKEQGTNSGWGYVSKSMKSQLHVNCVAKLAHEAWKEGGIEGRKKLVPLKRLNPKVIKDKKKSGWSKGGKFVKNTDVCKDDNRYHFRGPHRYSCFYACGCN